MSVKRQTTDLVTAGANPSASTEVGRDAPLYLSAMVDPLTEEQN